MTLMNAHSVAKTICGTVQWAARKADNPVFRDIEFDKATGSFRVTLDLPTDKPEVYEITATLIDGMSPREKLVRVAESFRDLTALQARQRGTMAEMIRACVGRIESPDSRKRREGIDGLRNLLAMLEAKS